jgi:hypothetical protein
MTIWLEKEILGHIYRWSSNFETMASSDTPAFSFRIKV